MYESALGNKTGKAVDVASGMLIHEAKHFDLPELEEPYNLLSRTRRIGEYNVMYPHVTPDENYTTDWRSILLFDEKKDGFRRIKSARRHHQMWPLDRQIARSGNHSRARIPDTRGDRCGRRNGKSTRPTDI
jgi:hypothetical protein